MSTHTAVQPSFANSSVDRLVDSLAERATATIANFDVLSTDLQRTKAPPSSDTPPSPSSAAAASWFQPLPEQSKSPLGKSGAFALVVAAHLLVFLGLANMPQSVRQRFTAPIQVVSIAEEPATNDVPPPPKPQLQKFDIPVEPIFLNVSDPDAMSITVQEQRQEAQPAAATVSKEPKMVSASAVDFIKDPVVKYPAAAKALRQRGTVVLRGLIDATGRITEVTIHKSSGHRTLDEAGRQAIFTAVFKPYVEDGQAQAVYVLIPIEFSVA